MSLQQFLQETAAFLSFVNRVYGLYLDAVLGFEKNRRETIEFQEQQLAQQGPPLTLDILDLAYVQHKREPSGRLQHITTMGEFKARNGRTGSNARFFATLCIATVYHYWEDHFRKRIAQAMGLPKNEVKIPIIGELRHYRQAIVHNNGIAIAEMEQCVEFRWFKRGERIELNEDQMDTIIQKIVQGVEKFQKDQM